ncbi:hypothetical protein [Paenibacillus sp. AR247]|uniref:hypothetical protein n=1 Tax=Paenibacillus sp. AR247 TaxID=1631599 RepID=UPI000CF84B30|nr:hypothetical protein [Paenibacillus sp. AR247]PQP90563.1 hypothetical protein CPT76_06310 [Paenibacillus sp. AR247]
MDKRKEILYHVEKLLKDKNRYIYTVVSPVDFTCFVTKERLSCEEIESNRFEAIEPGDRWGGDWMYAWLRSSVTAPMEAEGKRLVIRADFGSEATVYVNGIVRGGAGSSAP